jgi:hypothetical protein
VTDDCVACTRAVLPISTQSFELQKVRLGSTGEERSASPPLADIRADIADDSFVPDSDVATHVNSRTVRWYDQSSLMAS